MWVVRWICLSAFVLMASAAVASQPARLAIEPQMRHVRSGAEREWSEFPVAAPAKLLEAHFTAAKNTTEQTLLVRQQDVKQGWLVTLNGQKLGELVRDENDMVITFAVPEKLLVDSDNVLKIESPASSKAESDDIHIGQIELVACPVHELLREGTLEIEVVDDDSQQAVPCRVTVLDARGAMQTVSYEPGAALAVRPGTIFTSTGRATFGVPAGHYRIYAGRGFEYSLDQAGIKVARGDAKQVKLSIRREVPTVGYVACDTHVHTLTHSGHGDATIEERMVTLAGEGIELPIATDHNKHIDFEPEAVKAGVRHLLTPVQGCEVTTPRGHFNIFPVAAGARVVDSQQTEWGLLFDDIQRTPDVKAIILNHARDLHSGVRPFGAKQHNALVGENLDAWPLRFNAMEIINSGATQSEPLRLLRDWIGLLNRGLQVTPVGSSDSHDVARHFVGQGRTYIRCGDRDPSRIDVGAAVNNFVAGRVMVSYGLLAELTVNAQHHAGDLVTGLSQSDVRIDVRVLGPHWVRADRVQLLANGVVIREARIGGTTREGTVLPRGVKWVGGWTIPKPHHDVNLVAVATGPGVDEVYWRTAKPYQPLSIEWQATTIGCSGAIWIDSDNDGRATPARDYAMDLVATAGKDWPALVAQLSRYDEVIAAHAAYLVDRSGESLQAEGLLSALESGSPGTQAGFQAYREAARENELARTAR